MKHSDHYHECTDVTHGMNYRKVINKSWGYEVIHTNTPAYCMKTLHLFPDQETSLHYHLNKTETLYVSKGFVKIEYFIGNEENIRIVYLKEGSSFTVIPELKHKILNLNNSEAVIVEASTFDSKTDSYRTEYSE
jgi:mannose-6-phosphate isomerase-like protein (cupin superfamily)